LSNDTISRVPLSSRHTFHLRRRGGCSGGFDGCAHYTILYVSCLYRFSSLIKYWFHNYKNKTPKTHLNVVCIRWIKIVIILCMKQLLYLNYLVVLLSKLSM
jgi:hypothetical protein